jgi:hypothetical protein
MAAVLLLDDESKGIGGKHMTGSDVWITGAFV